MASLSLQQGGAQAGHPASLPSMIATIPDSSSPEWSPFYTASSKDGSRTLKVAFHRARTEDVYFIHSLLRSVYTEFGFVFNLDGDDKDLVPPLSRFAPPHHGLFICWDMTHQRPIGTCGFKGYPQGNGDDPSPFCTLSRVYLHPEYRGLGIGRMLVCYPMEQAVHTGYPVMELDSHSSLTDAGAMYARLGFSPITKAQYRATPHPCNDVFLKRSIAPENLPPMTKH